MVRCAVSHPLGTSILPLFAVGFLIFFRRDLILRELAFAQFVSVPCQRRRAGAVHFAFVDRRKTTTAGWGRSGNGW